MNPRQRRAAARRMTHRSRSVTVTTALTIVVIIAAWLGTEAVLAAVGRSPLLIAPAELLRAPTGPTWVAGLTAAVLAVLGITLLVIALTPGRRARRVLDDDRVVLVVDDTVLAGALSRSAASAARVPGNQVSTALSRRTARIKVSPMSGFPVSADVVTEAATQTVQDARPARPLTSRVDVATKGVLT